MSESLDHAPPESLAFDAQVEVDRQALKASALRQAHRLVEFYRITVEELEGSGAASDGSAAESGRPLALQPGASFPVASGLVRPNITLAPKYRHPVTGETWDGQGPHPEWMRQALLKDGYRVAELRVAEDTAVEPSTQF